MFHFNPHCNIRPSFTGSAQHVNHKLAAHAAKVHIDNVFGFVCLVNVKCLSRRNFDISALAYVQHLARQSELNRCQSVRHREFMD